MPTPIIARSLALLAACMLALPVCVRAEIACPDTLPVQQRAEVPDGWSVNYSGQAPRLSGVTLFDGPPSNRASIKYDLRTHQGKEVQVRWNLTYSPRSHYLQCSYERTTAQIATPLPPGVRICDVFYDRNTSYPSGGPVIKRMVCK